MDCTAAQQGPSAQMSYTFRRSDCLYSGFITGFDFTCDYCPSYSGALLPSPLYTLMSGRSGIRINLSSPSVRVSVPVHSVSAEKWELVAF